MEVIIMLLRATGQHAKLKMLKSSPMSVISGDDCADFLYFATVNGHIGVTSLTAFEAFNSFEG